MLQAGLVYTARVEKKLRIVSRAEVPQDLTAPFLSGNTGRGDDPSPTTWSRCHTPKKVFSQMCPVALLR